MKRLLLAIGTIAYTLAFGAETARAQQEHVPRVSLETAIMNTVAEFSPGFGSGSSVAVVSMGADTVMMADYLIDAMIVAFEGRGEFTTMNRAQLDLLARGTAFPTNQEVDVAMAQTLGILLGATVVVTGAFESLLDFYRFRVWAIDVRTAYVQNISAYVISDNIIALLMGLPLTQNLFTAGQRWGTWLLNLLPGLGSFVIMNDAVGGMVQIAAVGAGAILFVNNIRSPHDYLVVGGVMLIGIQQAFNAIRSFTYLRNARTILVVDPDLLNVAVIPDTNGSLKVLLSHTRRF